MSAAMICHNCGFMYDLLPGATHGPCPACGALNCPVQARGGALEKLQRAVRLRVRGDFSLAEQCYDDVLAEYDNEHEALWGRVLCHYGVEFVADGKHGGRYPLVHIPRRTMMQESADFEQACALAPEEIRAQYEADAAYVDEVQAEIRRLADRQPDYDVFLCHKTTRLDSEEKTKDYDRAWDLYHSLDKQGYRVFFAPRELKGTAGANYEAGIYHALHTARVMLVVCSDPAYLSSTWVQSEWQRYLELMGNEKDTLPRRLVPLLYGGMPAGSLPAAFRRRKLQGITMESYTAARDLQDLLERICGTRRRDTRQGGFTTADMGDGLCITGYQGREEVLSIPAQIGGRRVVAIGSGALRGNASLRTVVISEGVTEVGESAFEGCMRLETVLLPQSLRTIGARAFSMDASLALVTVHPGLRTIGDQAFYSCIRLQAFPLPDTLTEIGREAFSSCLGLSGELKLPDGLVTLGSNAFYGCHASFSVQAGSSAQRCAAARGLVCRVLGAEPAPKKPEPTRPEPAAEPRPEPEKKRPRRTEPPKAEPEDELTALRRAAELLAGAPAEDAFADPAEPAEEPSPAPAPAPQRTEPPKAEPEDEMAALRRAAELLAGVPAEDAFAAPEEPAGEPEPAPEPQRPAAPEREPEDEMAALRRAAELLAGAPAEPDEEPRPEPAPKRRRRTDPPEPAPQDEMEALRRAAQMLAGGRAHEQPAQQEPAAEPAAAHDPLMAAARRFGTEETAEPAPERKKRGAAAEQLLASARRFRDYEDTPQEPAGGRKSSAADQLMAGMRLLEGYMDED